jgi:hypothetical protein
MGQHLVAGSSFKPLFQRRRQRIGSAGLTPKIVEKALLDELRLHYVHAHKIAVRTERDAVKAASVPWFIRHKVTAA